MAELATPDCANLIELHNPCNKSARHNSCFRGGKQGRESLLNRLTPSKRPQGWIARSVLCQLWRDDLLKIFLKGPHIDTPPFASCQCGGSNECHNLPRRSLPFQERDGSQLVISDQRYPWRNNGLRALLLSPPKAFTHRQRPKHTVANRSQDPLFYSIPLDSSHTNASLGWSAGASESGSIALVAGGVLGCSNYRGRR